MKKFLVLFALFLSITSVLAAEEFTSPDEVVLDSESFIQEDLKELGIVTEESNKTSDNKTLREKLSDIYYSEVEQIDVRHHMLQDILTKKFSEDSPLEKVHWWGGYNGDWSMRFQDDGSVRNHYEFNALCTGFDGDLKNDAADFRIMFNFSPLKGKNMVRYLPGDVYFGTNKIPHHRIQIGNQRPGVGMEGKSSAFLLPLFARSQISRNYSSVRKLGARVIGDYSLLEYDFGLYSSDTYFKQFFPGIEFDGWVNVKPLGKTDGRYGEMRIGGGLQSGHRHGDYNVFGAYAEYKYKKFSASFEYANADGSNGLVMQSPDIHSSGFYTTLGYRITPKLQAIIRYDQFNPNHKIKNNNRRETTLGLNYFIKGQGLRLIFNYVFCQNDAAKDSHRLMLGTQILL